MDPSPDPICVSLSPGIPPRSELTAMEHVDKSGVQAVFVLDYEMSRQSDSEDRLREPSGDFDVNHRKGDGDPEPRSSTSLMQLFRGS